MANYESLVEQKRNISALIENYEKEINIKSQQVSSKIKQRLLLENKIQQLLKSMKRYEDKVVNEMFLFKNGNNDVIEVDNKDKVKSTVVTVVKPEHLGESVNDPTSKEQFELKTEFGINDEEEIGISDNSEVTSVLFDISEELTIRYINDQPSLEQLKSNHELEVRSILIEADEIQNNDSIIQNGVEFNFTPLNSTSDEYSLKQTKTSSNNTLTTNNKSQFSSHADGVNRVTPKSLKEKSNVTNTYENYRDFQNLLNETEPTFWP